MTIIDSYPIKEVYEEMSRVMHDADKKARKQKDSSEIFSAEVTFILSIFSHLSIRENYELYCYTCANDFHGHTGIVAGIEKGKSTIATTNGDRSFGFGPEIVLPPDAINPEEAVLRDGTPESFIEAELLHEILWFLPLQRNTYGAQGNIILFDAPEYDLTQWEWVFDCNIHDWHPRVDGENLYYYKYHWCAPLEAMSGKSEISFCHSTFGSWAAMADRIKNRDLESRYPNHLRRSLLDADNTCTRISNEIELVREI